MGVKTWLAERGLQRGIIEDGAELAAVWGERGKTAKRRLGTVAELRKTLTGPETRHRFGDALDELEAHVCRGETMLRDDEAVGDTGDVHHVIPPHHRIGHAVEESGDGFALETIERLHCRYTVLRRHGRVIGVSSTGVLRQEHYGPIRVI